MSAPVVLGLVPARGGSKGIPGKNIKPLAGKPLIGYSIEAARSSGCLSRIIVDTDAPQVAQIARQFQAEVPWLRPAQLATDSADVMDAVLLMLARLEQDQGYRPDAVVLLQPTSPLRSPDTIRAGCELFVKSGKESVISVSPVRTHPYYCRQITAEGTLEDFCAGVDVPANRQELPPAYFVDGSLFVCSVAELRAKRSFFNPPMIALHTPVGEALDIDTAEDWEFAEFICRRRRSEAQSQ